MYQGDDKVPCEGPVGLFQISTFLFHHIWG
jgi:hypothetical protein